MKVPVEIMIRQVTNLADRVVEMLREGELLLGDGDAEAEYLYERACSHLQEASRKVKQIVKHWGQKGGGEE